MSQLINRKIIEGEFEYKYLLEYLNDKQLEKGKQKLNKGYKIQIDNWNIDKNTEWVLRNYLATKMIMSSTIMLTTLKYGREKNIKVTDPYLIYYSLLNAARAVLYTNPYTDWKNGDLMELTHSKILNITGDVIGQFDTQLGTEIKKTLENAKDYRELFSYKFPARGIEDFTIDLDTAIEKCGFLAEFSQLQSEILESKNFKKENIEFNLNQSILQKGFTYNNKKFEYLDTDDLQRLNYIVRKQPFPVSLYFTLSEGMVDDFFGAWASNNDDYEDYIDEYDPDIDKNIIFSMP